MSAAPPLPASHTQILQPRTVPGLAPMLDPVSNRLPPRACTCTSNQLRRRARVAGYRHGLLRESSARVVIDAELHSLYPAAEGAPDALG